MTYKQALAFAALMGIGTYVALAAGRHATAASAVPYAACTALVMVLFGCAAVAYRNGKPRR